MTKIEISLYRITAGCTFVQLAVFVCIWAPKAPKRLEICQQRLTGARRASSGGRHSYAQSRKDCAARDIQIRIPINLRKRSSKSITIHIVFFLYIWYDLADRTIYMLYTV